MCMYVTLEPCPMCAKRHGQQVQRVVWGATDDPKAGATARSTNWATTRA
ncbi:MAG: hypothetical protein IPN77_30820 [Sandaracinaceae bacterium]|nr:hypothetical protein [Sandaracinaceae bacterium]